MVKASAPSLIKDSKLDVRNDRPELATNIDSRIEVLPQPFFPYKRVDLGDKSRESFSKHLKFLSSIFEKAQT